MKDLGIAARDPLVALQGGDPGPFEAFVESHTRRFLGFFARLGASRSESEDLVQETFLKLFRLAAQARPTASDEGPKGEVAPDLAYHDRGQFLAYSFRVARNVWIDRTRRMASAPGRTDDDASELSISIDARRPGSASPHPGAAVETQEESDRIRAAVLTLPETHRLVFELGILQELPYAAISQALEIPVGTVKSRMFNALKRVRATLLDAETSRESIGQRHLPETLPRTQSPKGQAS